MQYGKHASESVAGQSGQVDIAADALAGGRVDHASGDNRRLSEASHGDVGRDGSIVIGVGDRDLSAEQAGREVGVDPEPIGVVFVDPSNLVTACRVGCRGDAI